VVSAWGPPIACSRTGASHLRRGLPCQDSVAVATLRSRDGLPVQVMAVADGHGGRRHTLSDVGSRLACREALAQVAAALERRSLAGSGGPVERRAWREWLAAELPAAIHAAWLAAIRTDWQGRAAAPFTPLPYGSTLGLVLMTPLWWGHTGLGDWDLVGVDGGGAASLLSQEREDAALGGEATCSLCQSEAPLLWARRARLHPLPESAAGGLTLVLSTDGIRKACLTDADFLTLAAWLARAAQEPLDLAVALDRISADGSGDDVSIAIACHSLAAAPAPARRRSPLARTLPGAVAGCCLLLVAALLGRSAPLRVPTAAEAAVRRRAGELCALPPAVLAATLASRRRQFEDLRQGRRRPEALAAEAGRDPLGALIALSFVNQRSPMAAAGPEPPAGLPLCRPLREALQRQWRRIAAPSPSPQP
jgi:hypothetical protein